MPESFRDFIGESTENARPNAKEMAEEIAVRLEVRRKFYRGGLIVFAVILLAGVIVTGALSPPVDSTVRLYTLFGAFSAIVGTAVIFWWLYTMRKSQLYEQAGRTLLGEK